MFLDSQIGNPILGAILKFEKFDAMTVVGLVLDSIRRVPAFEIDKRGRF